MRKVTMVLVVVLCSAVLLGGQALDLVATARDKAIGVLEVARLVADRKGDAGSVLALDELVARLRQPIVVRSVKVRKTFVLKAFELGKVHYDSELRTEIEVRKGDTLLVRLDVPGGYRKETFPILLWGIRQADPGTGEWTKWKVKKHFTIHGPNYSRPEGVVSPVVLSELLSIEEPGQLSLCRLERAGETHPDIKVEVTVLEGGEGKTPD